MNKINKIKNLIKTYSAYAAGQNICNYPPLKLWIEVTARCNLECSLCANRLLEPGAKRDMEWALYKKIIDEARDFVFEVNLFHRGEPLLHPQIVQMVSYAANNNLSSCIHTNATLLDENMSYSLIKSGLDKISFSIDTFIKQDYEKNRHGADYDSVIKNIINFLKIKKDLKSKTPFASLQLIRTLSSSLNSDYKKHKEEFIKIFANLPLDRIAVRNPHNWAGSLDLQSSPDACKSLNANSTCTFPWYSLAVFFDGKAYPCPQDFSGINHIGDLNTQSIKDVFNSKTVRSLRKRLVSRNIGDLKPCNNCDRVKRGTFMKIPKEYLMDFIRGYIFFKKAR